MSIKPRFANAILDGDKTVELRRKAPTQGPPMVVIYGSGSARRVLGTARLAGVHTAAPEEIWLRFGGRAGVTRAEFDAYFSGSKDASALELSDPSRAAAQVDLDDLRDLGVRPPQSWRYLSGDVLEALLDALVAGPAAPTERNTDGGDDRAGAPREDSVAREPSSVVPRVLRRATDPVAAGAAYVVPCLVTRLQSRIRLGLRCWSALPDRSVGGEVGDPALAYWVRRSTPGSELT